MANPLRVQSDAAPWRYPARGNAMTGLFHEVSDGRSFFFQSEDSLVESQEAGLEHISWPYHPVSFQLTARTGDRVTHSV
jgi:hypothetical protein